MRIRRIANKINDDRYRRTKTPKMKVGFNSAIGSSVSESHSRLVVVVDIVKPAVRKQRGSQHPPMAMVGRSQNNAIRDPL